MKRFPILMAGLLALPAFGQVGALTPDQRIEIIRRGDNHPQQIQILRVKGDATVGGTFTAADLTVGDDAEITGDLTVTGNAKYHLSQATGSVTNGGSATLVAGALNYVTPSGQAANGTCAVSIVNFSATSVLMPTWIGVSATATNKLKLTKTGNYYGPTVVLAPGELIPVIATATNVILGSYGTQSE